MSFDDDSGGGPHEPTAAEVRATLERILASRVFAQAKRASDLLRFLVERTLAGEADRLKGYTIAIEVFRRPSTFDAQIDPLVRVEAGRLRSRLSQYYAAEGASDRVRIDVPRGRYVATFQYFANPASTRTPRRSARHAHWLAMTLAAAAGVGATALLATRDVEPPSASPSSPPSRPGIVVLPFENLSDDASFDYFAGGVTEEIMLRLSDFAVFVIARPTSWRFRDGDEPDADARYVLAGSVRSTVDSVRISAQLVDRVTGDQLWTGLYHESLTVDSLVAMQESVAREVAATIAVPYGPIFDAEYARTARKPPAQLGTYDCVLKYHYYRRTIDPALYQDVLGCFKRATVDEPGFADAWAGLAMLYVDEHAFGHSSRPTAPLPLERAREAARTAIDLNGASYLANLALARTRFFSGDAEGFRSSAERVLALEPNNPEALAWIGMMLAISGDVATGVPLVERSIALSPRPPGPYNLARVAAELSAGNHEQALKWAQQLDAPNWYVAPMVVAAAAAQAGRRDVATRAVDRLLELYPDFPQHARAELAKWQVHPQLFETLLEGLRAAGLDIE